MTLDSRRKPRQRATGEHGAPGCRPYPYPAYSGWHAKDGSEHHREHSACKNRRLLEGTPRVRRSAITDIIATELPMADSPASCCRARSSGPDLSSGARHLMES
jgi:hypothetical protein